MTFICKSDFFLFFSSSIINEFLKVIDVSSLNSRSPQDLVWKNLRAPSSSPIPHPINNERFLRCLVFGDGEKPEASMKKGTRVVNEDAS